MKAEVLDSYAILGWLQNEASAEYVQSRLEDADRGRIELYLSAMNAGEVYYLLAKRQTAHDALLWKEKLLPALPVRLIVPDLEGVFEAAKLKALYTISYADSFAASLALRHHVPLLTGDSEFRAISDLKLNWIGPTT